MKTAILTAAMVLAMPAFAFAQDKCYDDAKDQLALNECADVAFKKSDKKLLVQAQRDWSNFATPSAISRPQKRPEEA